MITNKNNFYEIRAVVDPNKAPRNNDCKFLVRYKDVVSQIEGDTISFIVAEFPRDLNKLIDVDIYKSITIEVA
jgi:hypothetical protein